MCNILIRRWGIWNIGRWRPLFHWPGRVGYIIDRKCSIVLFYEELVECRIVVWFLFFVFMLDIGIWWRLLGFACGESSLPVFFVENDCFV